MTKDASDGNYMLVMNEMDIDLTWKERIQITDDIIFAVTRIHRESAIHRDLHSENILAHQKNRFCGTADKPLNSIYGNLPYLALKVIVGKGTTFASDIYGIGMFMWKISSGQPLFFNYEMIMILQWK